jgi:hypothetical protein
MGLLKKCCFSANGWQETLRFATQSWAHSPLVPQHWEPVFAHAVTIGHAVVPSCVYSVPALATVGLTEEEAAAKGLAVKVTEPPRVCRRLFGLSHATIANSSICA